MIKKFIRNLSYKLNKRNIKNLIILYIIFIILIVIRLKCSVKEKPYYEIEFPTYFFIDNEDSFESNVSKDEICNPYNLNANQFKIKIGDEMYPKIIPIYQNKTINMTCLNSTLRKKRILLWNKFAGLPLDTFNEAVQKSLNKNCPVSNCEVVNDRSLANSSDYILFHMRRFLFIFNYSSKFFVSFLFNFIQEK